MVWMTTSLGCLCQDSRLQPWQFRQGGDAMRNLFNIVDTEWDRDVKRGFWRDSARTLEEQHATRAREHAPVTPEEFAKRIGKSRFATLIHENLHVFSRSSTVIDTRPVDPNGEILPRLLLPVSVPLRGPATRKPGRTRRMKSTSRGSPRRFTLRDDRSISASASLGRVGTIRRGV